jgi:cytochrome c556
MRSVLTALYVVALVVTAACNRSEPEAAPEGNATAATGNTSQAATAANVADSIKARQTHYKEIGRAMKGINDELKAGSPNVQAIQGHATQLRTFAPQIQGWFPSGSGSEAGLKTRAKQEIWSDPEGFRRASEAFVNATERFHGVTQAGDVQAIRAAVPDLGASCKGCHDKFRAPEE